MKIHALTVCVDYADKLERSLARWHNGLESLWVVTSFEDKATEELVMKQGGGLFRTGAFYESGAYFNKGRAMQYARELLPASDWHLFIDADVIPPEDWKLQLECADPQPGILHGAQRVFEDGRPCPDHELAGFFQLFHSSDPKAAAPLATNYYHGANYDSEFMFRWPRDQQRILPLTLVHLGEVGQNWCGVGNDEAMQALRQRRLTRSWRTETIE